MFCHLSCFVQKWGVPQHSNFNRDDAKKSLDLLLFFSLLCCVFASPINSGWGKSTTTKPSFAMICTGVWPRHPNQKVKLSDAMSS